MTSVGDYLKKEREARHLNLQEVAELTKISERYLACIECGDYDQLPPGPYAKGYIAAYARQVCGDETEALELYTGYRAAFEPTDPEPSDEDAATSPQLNGNGGSKWQAKVATGFSFARSLRDALPEKGNLKYISNQGDKEKSSLAALFQPLLAPLNKAAAALKGLPKGLLLKGGLTVCLMLICAAVLVLAGFGVYHLFFFNGASESVPALQAQATTTPPVSDTKAGKKSTPSQASVQSAPKAKSAPLAKAPPHKSQKVKKPSKLAPLDPKPITAEAQSKIKPKISPVVPEKAAKTQNDTPKIAAAATAKAATAQPSTPAVTAPRADTAPATVDIPVELVKASVCTAIEERMPAGVGKVFPWTTPKIYVWSLLRTNEPPVQVRHIYYHDGHMVSDVPLTVGSSHWRTWSFHTLSGQLHLGPWHIDIATMDGRVMRRLHFEIQ